MEVLVFMVAILHQNAPNCTSRLREYADSWRACRSRCSSGAVAGFDGLDGVCKGLFQNAGADGPEQQTEKPSLEVLAFAYDDYVYVGQTIGTTREGVGVARRASPGVGVGGGEDNAVGIGPVVVQAFPDAARDFRDVGLRGPRSCTLRYSSALLPSQARSR